MSDNVKYVDLLIISDQFIDESWFEGFEFLVVQNFEFLKPFRGITVKAIKVDDIADKSNSWFNELVDYAKTIGMPGIGYFKVMEDMTFAGPIDKFLSDSERNDLINMKTNRITIRIIIYVLCGAAIITSFFHVYMFFVISYPFSAYLAKIVIPNPELISKTLKFPSLSM